MTRTVDDILEGRAPAMRQDPPDLMRLEVTSLAQLLAWLGRHHAQVPGVLLVTYKKHVPARYVSRSDVLDAVVAHGWTDGRRWAVDADRTMQLISPRRTQVWARSYRQRAERLIREGRMHPAAHSAYLAAKASPRWLESEPVDSLQVPADLARELEAAPGAAAYFRSTAPSYRRNVLRWISLAKRPATRAARLNALVAACVRRARLPHY